MLRSLVMAVSLLLACGGFWACGRKSAPRLPEGEQLRVQGKGFEAPINVYSPYEEELEQIRETGDTLDPGVEEYALPGDKPDLVVEPPESAQGTIRQRAPAEIEEELEVGEVAPPSGDRPETDTTTGAAPTTDPTRGLRRGVEDLLRSEEKQSPEADYSPTDQGGLPPSPGSPLEGGF
ncbi:MAG: hypothetical protein Q8R92_11550 [Deltaproteobacteria bacterium]|nr:hypothetical protein [Deltaproteobacteria bacterium]